MCDFGRSHEQYGFLVDVPEIRALVGETRRLTADIPDTRSRVEALRPAFAKLLAADDWQTVKHGEFYTLLPPLDDIPYVKTVSDTPSISIHLLANDTACVTRNRFDATSGIVTPFRSGYSNAKCACVVSATRRASFAGVRAEAAGRRA